MDEIEGMDRLRLAVIPAKAGMTTFPSWLKLRDGRMAK
jgi:hypothetical protein